MKKYIPLAETTLYANALKIEVYYSLGGYNCFTGKEEKRGYYISVSPVDRRERNGIITESYMAFSGIKQCIKTVSRKSAKAEKEAELLAADVEKQLIEYVCSKNQLSIMEEK